MDMELVHEVDPDSLTAKERDLLKTLLRRVLDGDGYKLTAMQERAGAQGRFRLMLEWEPDPNPANFVAYAPLGAP